MSAAEFCKERRRFLYLVVIPEVGDNQMFNIPVISAADIVGISLVKAQDSEMIGIE